jgi:anti-anti-sigma factor
MAEIRLPRIDLAVVRLPGASVFSTGPGTVTLALLGEVDRLGTPILKSALDVVWAESPRRVVVDLTEVDFLGLSAVHALLSTRMTAQRRGVQLTLTTASTFMVRLLDLAGAGDVTVLEGSRLGARRQTPAGTREVSDEAPLRSGLLTLVPEAVAPNPSRPPNVGEFAPAADDVLLGALREASSWGSSDDPQSVMVSLCRAVVAGIPEAAGAGVLLHGPGAHDAVLRAATDPRAESLAVIGLRPEGAAGDEQGWGTVWTAGQPLMIDDLREDRRWPRLAARADELHVRGVMCLPLGAPRSVGHLTVYSCRAGAFRAGSLRLAEVYAAVGRMLLPAARRRHDLARQLATRDVIGQAKGILMERNKCSADQAYGALRRASCVTNTRLRTLAARLANTGELTVGAGRPSE